MLRSSASGCASTKRRASVVFPAPDGAESTSSRPRWMSLGAHSTFWTCSRIRSSSALSSTMRAAISARWLLEPWCSPRGASPGRESPSSGRRARCSRGGRGTRQVGPEPGGLLGHVGPLGEERHLLRQPRLVHRRPPRSSATRSLQALPGTSRPSSARAPRPPTSVATRCSRADEVRLERPALTLPHRHQRGQRVGERPLQRGLGDGEVRDRLLHPHHAGLARDLRDGERCRRAPRRAPRSRAPRA